MEKSKIFEGLNQILAPFAEIDILYFDPFGSLLEDSPFFQNPNFLDLPTFQSILKNKTNFDGMFLEILEDSLFSLVEKVFKNKKKKFKQKLTNIFFSDDVCENSKINFEKS